MPTDSRQNGVDSALALYGVDKTAASRMEKEIAKGNIRRSDVVPGVSDSTGLFSGRARRAARDSLQAAPAVSPEQLSRNRVLSDKLYRAQTKAMPNGIDFKDELYPGAGPATNIAGKPTVHSPDTAGRFLRTLEKPAGAPRAIFSTLPVKDEWRDQALVPAAPQDATLNHAVFRHELGEAQTHLSGSAAPVASHFGVRPMLEENMASRGDPEAQATFARLRKMHPDDVLVQKQIRQMGGLPGRPLPIGGKHEARLNEMIGRDVSKLAPETRAGAAMSAGEGRVKVPYVPASVAAAADPAIAGKRFEEMSNAGSASELWSKLKDAYQAQKPFTNFVEHGTPTPSPQMLRRAMGKKLLKGGLGLGALVGGGALLNHFMKPKEDGEKTALFGGATPNIGAALSRFGKGMAHTLVGDPGKVFQQFRDGTMFASGHGVYDGAMKAPGTFNKVMTYGLPALSLYAASQAGPDQRGSSVGGVLGSVAGTMLGRPLGLVGEMAGSTLLSNLGNSVGHTFDRPSPTQPLPQTSPAPAVQNQHPLSQQLSSVTGRPA
jgi:hypothetical protein